MARITVEDCLENVENRFKLVLLAAKRARDITMKGIIPHVPWGKDKPTVVALREIAEGHIKNEYLHKVVKVAPPEEPEKATEEQTDDTNGEGENPSPDTAKQDES